MKFNKIFSALAGGLLLCGVSSCTEEVDYNGAQKPSTEGVYFSTTEPSDVALSVDQSSFEVYVYRVDTKGELTVGIQGTITDEDGNDASSIFTIPTSVTFADGAELAAIEVQDVFEKVEPEHEYTMTLTVETDQTSDYGAVSKTYSIVYAPWSDFENMGIGTFQMASMWSYKFDQYIYKAHSLVNPSQEMYICLGPFSDLDMQYEITMDKTNGFTDANGNECYYVTTNLINTTLVNPNYGEEMWYTDSYTYARVVRGFSADKALEWMDLNGFSRSYYNDTQGRFYLYMISYISQGLFGEALETLQLPGEFEDYYINFAKTGNFVDAGEAEFTVISAYKSEDLYGYAYHNFEGTPTDEDIDAALAEIMDDIDNQLITDENRTLYIPYTEDGDYTLVGYGFNQTGTLVHTEKFAYKAETVKAASEWHDVGLVEYTDGFVYSMYKDMAAFTWEVMLQEHNDTPNYFRIKRPYDEWPLNENQMFSLEGKYYMYINATNANRVYIECNPLGLELSPDDGQIYIGSMAAYYLNNGWSENQIISNVGDVFGKMKDGKITFPTQSLLLAWENIEGGEYYLTNFDLLNGQIVPNSGKFLIDMTMLPSGQSAAPLKSARNKSVTFNGPLSRLEAAATGLKASKKKVEMSADEYREYTHRNIRM